MKRKVNIDRKPLASDEINATKDFGSLMSKVGGAGATSPKPNGSKMSWFVGGIAAIAIATGIYVGTQENTATTEAQETLTVVEQVDSTEEKPFVNPPIPELDIKKESYFVNADKGGKIKHHTGTEITIPKGAFMDEEGNIVEGEVEVQYREFHDQADIFLSGIPMDYDTLGEKHIFESAGMMEIRGFQNGKRLKITPEKNFVICMHTKNPDPKFNIYYLDEEKRKWDYEGKDSISVTKEIKPEIAIADTNSVEIRIVDTKYPIDETPSEIELVEEKIEVIKKEVTTIKETKPRKPKKANKEKKNFKIDVIDGEYPELVVYSGTIFEVTGNQDLPDDTYQVTWNDIKLKEKKGDYIIQLIKDDRKEEIAVTPVLEGEDYEVAIKKFKQKFGEYETKLKDKVAAQKVEEKKLAKLKEKYAKQQEARERTLQAMKRNMTVQQTSTAEMQRVFKIRKFGTWNADYPVKPPSGMMVNANYVDETTGEELSFSKLDLIEKSTNACYPLDFARMARMPFNPRRKNALWGVTENGMIAVAKPSEFKNIDKRSKSHTFRMIVFDVKDKTTSEIKKLLKS